MGCTTYEPQPVALREILNDFEEASTTIDLRSMAVDGLTPRQAAAWAVQHNPGLAEVRARLGVAKAELIEAGLLADPEIGWDAMDVLAVKLNGGTARTEEYLAGLGLSWPVPRPGEIGAKVGFAEARKEEVRQQVLTAEWRIVRAIYLAHLDALVAQAEFELMDQQVQLAQRTADFFAEARKVGGATAIQENLAATEVATLQQERIHVQGVLEQARQALNELLGVSPDTELTLSGAETSLAIEPSEGLDINSLIASALELRPDLAQMLSRYRQAEETLRLEIARQWPQLSIGTGFFIELPIFTQFNQPAIRTAMARREALGRQVRTAVYQLRAEIHAALADLENSKLEVSMIERELLPRLQRALDTTDEAFRLRELTLFEILTTQRQVLDTRRRHLNARAERAQARIRTETITGAILMDENTEKGEER